MSKSTFITSGQQARVAVVPVFAPSQNSWEAAYVRFETPQEEIRKFVRRLKKMGSERWPRDAEIVELFCGRGNGLQALTALGFTRLSGVDLSLSLLAKYAGPAKCYLADCRRLLFDDSSKDIVVIHGGLHHLPILPDDLEQTLSGINRILRNDGLLCVVEPWLTPFLYVVHQISRSNFARMLSRKIDAFATMTHYEHQTYEQWLSGPQLILSLLKTY